MSPLALFLLLLLLLVLPLALVFLLLVLFIVLWVLNIMVVLLIVALAFLLLVLARHWLRILHIVLFLLLSDLLLFSHRPEPFPPHFVAFADEKKYFTLFTRDNLHAPRVI